MIKIDLYELTLMISLVCNFMMYFFVAETVKEQQKLATKYEILLSNINSLLIKISDELDEEDEE